MESNVIILTGTVARVQARGNMGRSIDLDADLRVDAMMSNEEHGDHVQKESHPQNPRHIAPVPPSTQLVRIQLDACSQPATKNWMTIQRARHLICDGVRLKITCLALPTMTPASDNNSGLIPEYLATKLELVRVLSTPTYLARLFSFPLSDLHLLFHESSILASDADQIYFFPRSLLLSLVPCTPQKCMDIWQFSQSEQSGGRGDRLWKSPVLVELSKELQEYDCPGSTTTRLSKIPKTGARMEQALNRFEQQWCGDITQDGPIPRYQFQAGTHTYTSSLDATAASTSDTAICRSRTRRTICRTI